jgi:DNA-binding GntR family transcriptional regulator
MAGRLEAFLASTAPLAALVESLPEGLPGQIANALRDRIQAGEFKPGDPLRAAPLAVAFGCSRGPVREALRRLEREKLVVVAPRTGAVVAQMDARALEAHFRLRAEIGALFVRLAAERAQRPPALTAAILEGAEVLAEVAADQGAEVGDYLRARRRLTDLIATLAAAPYVAELSQELEREVAILWAPMNSAARRRRSAAGWRKIARAIAAGDPDAAEVEGRRMVLESLDEVRRMEAMF